MNIKIINGPNLNLLGKREVEIYGNKDFDTFFKELQETYRDINIDYFQSNIEGEIIDELQSSEGKYEGIILNAAGYTHTSVSIADAIAAMSTPVIEVHISNIMNREKFREKSLMATSCIGTISGFGLLSYELAIEYLIRKSN